MEFKVDDIEFKGNIDLSNEICVVNVISSNL